MTYLYLENEKLCDERNPESVQFAMQEWRKTNSPYQYWHKKLQRLADERILSEFKMDFIHPKQDDFDLKFIRGPPIIVPVPLVNGLPFKEGLRVCKRIYSENIAKVTIEIATDQVIMTKKDIRVTFQEQLAIISMNEVSFQGFHNYFHTFIYRWDNRSLHWSEPHESN